MGLGESIFLSESINGSPCHSQKSHGSFPGGINSNKCWGSKLPLFPYMIGDDDHQPSSRVYMPNKRISYYWKWEIYVHSPFLDIVDCGWNQVDNVPPSIRRVCGFSTARPVVLETCTRSNAWRMSSVYPLWYQHLRSHGTVWVSGSWAGILSHNHHLLVFSYKNWRFPIGDFETYLIFVTFFDNCAEITIIVDCGSGLPPWQTALKW